jgi:hypothetical protein
LDPDSGVQHIVYSIGGKGFTPTRRSARVHGSDRRQRDILSRTLGTQLVVGFLTRWETFGVGATPALTMLQTQIEISRFLTKGAKQLVSLAVLFNGR